MFRSSRLLAICIVTCLATSAASLRVGAAEPENASPVEALARFVGGSWVTRADGAETDASHMRVRVVYEWGINHRLLKARSYLTGEKGDQLVYESVFYWHPGTKKLTFTSISAEGGIFEGATTPTAGGFESVFDSIAQDSKTTYKQTLTFLDDDTLQWTVLRKQGDDWSKMIDSKLHRVRESAAHAR